MATRTECDRCRCAAQVAKLTLDGGPLGELCAGCIGELRGWLVSKIKPEYTATGKVRNRLQQAQHHIRVHGICSAATLAQENGEPERRAYFGLRELADRGLLKHLGRGVYVLPEAP